MSGYSFAGEREMKKPSGNSVEACTESLAYTGGYISFLPSSTKTMRTAHGPHVAQTPFRTSLNWNRYSTAQKLRVLADSYDNILHSLASAV